MSADTLHLSAWAHTRKASIARSRANDGLENGVEQYKKKVDSTYRPGYGTVLFFESHKILEDWGGKMPNYSKVRSP
jgi:predicted oxidoreductase (fatty acid repression mutant protein)